MQLHYCLPKDESSKGHMVVNNKTEPEQEQNAPKSLLFFFFLNPRLTFLISLQKKDFWERIVQ